jgi:hypothetical protein
MARLQYTYIIDKSGPRAFTMPSGFKDTAVLHLWGAGGGAGHGQYAGGGGGYIRATVAIQEGDIVELGVGLPGSPGNGMTPGTGGGSSIGLRYSGGPGGSGYNVDGDNDGPYAGGGGGGATVVMINGIVVGVAGGGGGGGGLGDDYIAGSVGLSGGNYVGLTSNTQGAAGAYGGGGGGGGGYLGGTSGSGSVNAVRSAGGSGGQNYGAVAIAGTGTISGGVGQLYAPSANYGHAGYGGYAVIEFTRKFQIYTKDSSQWHQVLTAWVKTPIRQVPATIVHQPQTFSFTESATSTFKVPNNVTVINVTATGGGGGGGGADGGAGGGRIGGGYPGSRVAGTISVTPGQLLTITPGNGGGGGAGRASSATPGAAGTGHFPGGRGGYAGGAGSSGAGGGGGAATVVLYNGSPILVAGGGGGAGGSGNGAYGVDTIGTYTSGTTGAPGQDKAGDGGGGGFTQGGSGGPTRGGDSGGYSGQTGKSLVPAGTTEGVGTNGGAFTSGQGGRGSVTITYTLPTEYITVADGGWKQIEQVYEKYNGVWHPVVSADTLNDRRGGRYTTPGTYIWVCPNDIVRVKAMVYGAGGSGTGGGGGAGGFSTDYTTVTPGTQYVVVVGSGATADGSAAGQSSSFNVTIVAQGGGRGAARTGGTDAGGTGGTSAGGDTNLTGASGSAGQALYSYYYRWWGGWQGYYGWGGYNYYNYGVGSYGYNYGYNNYGWGGYYGWGWPVSYQSGYNYGVPGVGHDGIGSGAVTTTGAHGAVLLVY